MKMKIAATIPFVFFSVTSIATPSENNFAAATNDWYAANFTNVYERAVSRRSANTNDVSRARSCMETSCLVIDDSRYMASMKRTAMACCGGDTNIMAGIAMDILEEKRSSQYCGLLIYPICATDTNVQSRLNAIAVTAELGCPTIKAMVWKEGLSSRVMDVSRTYLNREDVDALDRADVCMALMRYAGTHEIGAGVRDDIKSIVLASMQKPGGWSQGTDRMLCGLDPTYARSKRRLEVLRSASESPDTRYWPYWEAYATNAINELVAYPESELSD